VYIKATPQAIWDAIKKPECPRKYGYTGLTDIDLRAGGKARSLATPELLQMGTPEVLIDGEVLELDPPRKLVLTWRMLMDPALQAEGFTRLTYEIEQTKTACPRDQHRYWRCQAAATRRSTRTCASVTSAASNDQPRAAGG
jgi:uncharacterized protein YndB with AHSA1/START domain